MNYILKTILISTSIFLVVCVVLSIGYLAGTNYPTISATKIERVVVNQTDIASCMEVLYEADKFEAEIERRIICKLPEYKGQVICQ